MSPPVSPPTGWTALAHILRPQGRKGEVLAELLTDFPAHFDEREGLFLATEGFSGGSEDARPVRISGHWLPVGRNQGRVVLSIEGVASIEQAETLVGMDVMVRSTERVELPEDEEYIDDLVGCAVYDWAQGETSTQVGEVTAVDFPTTPDGARRLADAAPLLTVLTAAGHEVLIPYVQAFLVSLSTAEKRIEMRLPVGLIELNRTAPAGPEE